MKKILIFGLLVLCCGCGRKDVDVSVGNEYIRSLQPVETIKSVNIENSKSQIQNPKQIIPRSGIPQGGTNYKKEEKSGIDVSLDINGKKKINLAVAEGATVYDLLRQAQSRGEINLKIKNYDFGVFIEEIDGLKNSKKGKNWFLYVNNKLSEVGASGKKLKDGDKVKWLYK